ncbi:uncharacterized protein LOC117642965 [Thrips palmi]|uniref:Uncharacterized protein LOC117642965 n=1 Tax=Thrips palmi TaxID=161013 RepID=A0A6P8YTT6_THRPL|nr:uncharacterized protein LOC117642965 [Thrips palmi]
MSVRPEWDAFLLDSSPPEPPSSWSWEWRPPLVPAGAALLAAATVAAPVLVWLSLAYLRQRAETSLAAMRKFVAAARARMWDMDYDPKLRQCLRALRQRDKEFAELLKACDDLPGQSACSRACKQMLGCGSGDVALEASDVDLALSDSHTCCDTADDEVHAARRSIAVEQGDWYRGAAHGLCLQHVEDSSEDDADPCRRHGLEARDVRDLREEQLLWRQLYAEERRRNRPR